jgi:hypothetical protein
VIPILLWIIVGVMCIVGVVELARNGLPCCAGIFAAMTVVMSRVFGDTITINFVKRRQK